jgi:uncharacterized lipoprotein YmbA
MRGPALAAALAMAACVSLAPPPDRTRYWVLEPQGRPPEPARAPVPELGVGPVRLPDYLDRSEIVTRAGPGRLEVSTLDRWSAPLEALFTSALAEDLRRAVPAREVPRWPWSASAPPEWSVSVDVLRFEAGADGFAVLEARWTVRRGGALASEGATSARERREGPEIAHTVAALGKALGGLARDVAAAVDASRREEVHGEEGHGHAAGPPPRDARR